MLLPVLFAAFLLGQASGEVSPRQPWPADLLRYYPGPSCAESVEVCVPRWRDYLAKLGSFMARTHITPLEDGPPGGTTVWIEEIVPGGPADRAGLRDGDRLLAINGKDLSMWAQDVIYPLALRLQVGEKAVFTAERAGQRFDVTLRAEKILDSAVDNWLGYLVRQTFGIEAARRYRASRQLPGQRQPP